MAEAVSKITDHLRVPPNSVDAEQSVLGGLMLDTESWDKVADRISAQDFYRKDHRLIFEAIADLRAREQPSDVITVGEWLEDREMTKDAGGTAYLIGLARDIPSAANIMAYADIVRDKAVLRELIDAGTEITTSAFQPDGRDTKDLLENAEQRVFDIRERRDRTSRTYIPIQVGVRQALERIEHLFDQEGSITGVPTGFKDFDEKTAGLQPTDLIIVAGRPAMGKTSFALNIAENAAIKHNVPVAVFSMEMAAVQLVTRMVSSLGRINQHNLRTGNLDDDDWPRITSAMKMLTETKIFIDETPSLTPIELRARARRIKREHDLGLIVIDYLQLMHVSGNKENRATEIAEISRSLKALAKELEVPVVALSQLNRALEQRPNKRPIMADLRESGGIEQDADLIAFIYRDEVYNEDTQDKGKAEIIIGKQRNGSTGTVTLTFQGQYTRFDNFSPDFYVPE